MRNVLRFLGPACALLLALGTVPSPAQTQFEFEPELKALYVQALEFYRAGKFAEALPLAERYADAIKAQLGPEHPEYATALINVAQLLKATNRLSEAEPLMRNALAIN